MIRKAKEKRSEGKPVRLADVAKAAGVSASTASVVLNPDRNAEGVRPTVAERVRSTAARLGYVPNYHARTMRLRKAFAIAVALEIHSDRHDPHARLANHYFSELVGAIDAKADAAGYTTSIFGSSEFAGAVARSLDALMQRRIDGIIVPAAPDTEKLGTILAQCESHPVVLLEYPGTTTCPVINWDETAAVEMALKHLSELGHQRILWMGLSPKQAGEVMPLREQLFLRQALALGIKPVALQLPSLRSSPVGKDVPRHDERMVRLAEQTLTHHLQKEKRTFTAVLAFNDFIAIGACAALSKAGLRVPRDVSVMGFDNISAGLCIPPLTTVDHMLITMGRIAVDALQERMNLKAGETMPAGKRRIISPQLVVRESTGPATKA